MSAVQIIASGDRIKPLDNTLINIGLEDFFHRFDLAVRVRKPDPVRPGQTHGDFATIFFGHQFFVERTVGHVRSGDHTETKQRDHQRAAQHKIKRHRVDAHQYVTEAHKMAEHAFGFADFSVRQFRDQHRHQAQRNKR